MQYSNVMQYIIECILIIYAVYINKLIILLLTSHKTCHAYYYIICDSALPLPRHRLKSNNLVNILMQILENF